MINDLLSFALVICRRQDLHSSSSSWALCCRRRYSEIGNRKSGGNTWKEGRNGLLGELVRINFTSLLAFYSIDGVPGRAAAISAPKAARLGGLESLERTKRAPVPTID